MFKAALPSASGDMSERQGSETAPFARGAQFNWSDLVFFLELARQQSLSAAARRLNVDHTTVSRRVRELETSLSVKLFHRTRDGCVLTDAGADLRRYAERMEATALSISHGLGQTDVEASGVVRVATMEAIGSLYVAPKIDAFNARHPDITIELVTAAHWVSLSKREADILISFPPPQGRRLKVRKIGRFALWLFAAQSYLEQFGAPDSVADLSRHRFVDYIDDLVQIDAVRWLSEGIGAHEARFRSSSLIAQFMSVCSGAGIAMLPSFVAAHDPTLRKLLADQVEVRRDIWLTIHEDLLHVARIKLVAKFMQEQIGRDAGFLMGEVAAPVDG